MKKIVVFMLSLLLVATLSLSLPLALAGWNNQNDDSGNSLLRGTGKVNMQEGCRPNIQAGSITIDMGFSPEELGAINAFLGSLDPPLYLTTDEWEGGPCCPSNQYDSSSSLPLPNQCCNPPDMGPPGTGVPGNHCECFELRGYPFPNAVAPLS
jgi:hypothetical protein